VAHPANERVGLPVDFPGRRATSPRGFEVERGFGGQTWHVQSDLCWNGSDGPYDRARALNAFKLATLLLLDNPCMSDLSLIHPGAASFSR